MRVTTIQQGLIFVYELGTCICIAGALLLIEHLTLRHLPFLARYCLGMTAFLIGFGARCSFRNDMPAFYDAVWIAVGGGAFVLIAYGLRYLWAREIRRAREAGRIQGRVEKDNHSATGIARTRDD